MAEDLQRTGVIACDHMMPSWELEGPFSPTDVKEHIHLLLCDAVGQEIARRISDGREYNIRLTETASDLEGTHRTSLTALLLLTRPESAAVGEYCVQTHDGPRCMMRPLSPSTRPGDSIAEAAIFETCNIPFGGRYIRAWKRGI